MPYGATGYASVTYAGLYEFSGTVAVGTFNGTAYTLPNDYYSLLIATETASILGHYKLDEPVGSTALVDSSGRVASGLATSPTNQSGAPPGSVTRGKKFTNTTTRGLLERVPLASPISPLGATDLTVAVWFLRTGNGTTVSIGTGGQTAMEPLVCKGVGEQETPDNLNANYALGVVQASKFLGFDFEAIPGGQNFPTTGTVAVANDVWNFGVVTYDGYDARLYLNGVPDKIWHTATNRVPCNTSRQPAGIGNSWNSGTTATGGWTGTMAHATIWNKAISPAQVASLYAEGATSGDTLTTVHNLRSAAWDIQETTYAAVVSIRPTTWDIEETVYTAVVSIRPTTWDIEETTYTAVVSIRPTTWDIEETTYTAVVSIRPTTWDIEETVYTAVVSIRPTTWDIEETIYTAVVSIRPTTWDIEGKPKAGKMPSVVKVVDAEIVLSSLMLQLSVCNPSVRYWKHVRMVVLGTPVVTWLGCAQTRAVENPTADDLADILETM